MRQRISEETRGRILQLAADGKRRSEIMTELTNAGISVSKGTVSNILYFARHGTSSRSPSRYHPIRRSQHYAEKGCKHDGPHCMCVNPGKRDMNEYYREAGIRRPMKNPRTPLLVGSGD